MGRYYVYCERVAADIYFFICLTGREHRALDNLFPRSTSSEQTGSFLITNFFGPHTQHGYAGRKCWENKGNQYPAFLLWMCAVKHAKQHEISVESQRRCHSLQSSCTCRDNACVNQDKATWARQRLLTGEHTTSFLSVYICFVSQNIRTFWRFQNKSVANYERPIPEGTNSCSMFKIPRRERLFPWAQFKERSCHIQPLMSWKKVRHKQQSPRTYPVNHILSSLLWACAQHTMQYSLCSNGMCTLYDAFVKEQPLQPHIYLSAWFPHPANCASVGRNIRLCRAWRALQRRHAHRRARRRRTPSHWRRPRRLLRVRFPCAKSPSKRPGRETRATIWIFVDEKNTTLDTCREGETYSPGRGKVKKSFSVINSTIPPPNRTLNTGVQQTAQTTSHHHNKIVEITKTFGSFLFVWWSLRPNAHSGIYAVSGTKNPVHRQKVDVSRTDCWMWAKVTSIEFVCCVQYRFAASTNWPPIKQNSRTGEVSKHPARVTLQFHFTSEKRGSTNFKFDILMHWSWHFFLKTSVDVTKGLHDRKLQLK